MTGAVRELGLETYSESIYRCTISAGATSARCGSTVRCLRRRARSVRPRARSGETTNPARRAPRGRRSDARRRLQALHARSSAAGPSSRLAPAVDPEARARLAALGYVGSFVATSAQRARRSRDPKDKIALFNLDEPARETGQDAATPGSRRRSALLRRVQAADPQVIDAWSHARQRSISRRDDSPTRSPTSGKALALKPDYDLALINMANAYRAPATTRRRWRCEQYLRIDPKNAYVPPDGRDRAGSRRSRGAERRFREALAIDAKVAPAHVALGVLAFQARGDLAAAEREITPRSRSAGRPARALQPALIAETRKTGRRPPPNTAASCSCIRTRSRRRSI